MEVLKWNFFSGTPAEDATKWIDKFEAWLTFNGWDMDNNKVVSAMRLNLEGSALSWFHALSHPVSRDKGKLITAFKEHFGQLHPKWMLEQQLYDRCMSTSENLESYITDIESRCARLNKSNTEMTTAFIR